MDVVWYRFKVKKILWRKFKAICAFQGRNMSHVLIELVELYVNKKKNRGF